MIAPLMDEAEFRRAARFLDKQVGESARRLRRRFGMTRSRRLESLPELQGVHLPRWLATDVVTPKGEPLDGLTYFYSPEGLPFPGDFMEQVGAFAAYRVERASHILARTFYRAGCPIRVSTVYLGIDMGNDLDEPPLIWETMVFSGDSYRDTNCWRYATPAAALNGHRQVVATVRGAQRARRVADAARSPRRSPAAACRAEHPGVTCNQFMEIVDREAAQEAVVRLAKFALTAT